MSDLVINSLVVQSPDAVNPVYETLSKSTMYMSMAYGLTDASRTYSLEPLDIVQFVPGKYSFAAQLTDIEVSSASLDNLFMSSIMSPQGAVVSLWLNMEHAGDIWRVQDTKGTVLGLRATDHVHVTVNNMEVIKSNMALDRRAWVHVALQVVQNTVSLYLDGLNAGSAIVAISDRAPLSGFFAGGCGTMCELRLLRGGSVVDILNLSDILNLDQPETITSTALNVNCDGTLIINNRPAAPCRAWVNFDASAMPAINGCFNVSSVTRNAVGDMTVHFSTPMPHDNTYAVSLAVPSGFRATTYRDPNVYRPEMSSWCVRISITDESGVPADCANCCVTVTA